VKYRIFLFLMIVLVLAAHLLIIFNAQGVSVRMWRLETSIIRAVFTPDIEGVSIVQNYMSIPLIGSSLAIGGQLALLISLCMVKLSLQQKWVKIALPCLWISILLLAIGVNLLEMIIQSLLFVLLSIVLYILAKQNRE